MIEKQLNNCVICQNDFDHGISIAHWGEVYFFCEECNKILDTFPESKRKTIIDSIKNDTDLPMPVETDRMTLAMASSVCKTLYIGFYERFT